MQAKSMVHLGVRGIGLVFLALIALLAIPSLSAQVEKGIITGVVSDASGAVLTKAHVSLTNLATGIVTSATTDSAGIYASPPLDAGNYEITISAPGLAKAVKNARLEVAQRIRVDAVLQVASDVQTVTVDATTIQFDTETSTLSNLRTEQAVHDLPLNGRNFAELLGLGAGVVAGQSQLTTSIPYVQQRGPSSYGFNGLRLTADAQETYVFIAALYAANQFSFDKLVPWLRSHVTQAPSADPPR